MSKRNTNTAIKARLKIGGGPAVLPPSPLYVSDGL